MVLLKVKGSILSCREAGKGGWGAGSCSFKESLAGS